jgi:cation/acetate symporter
MRCADALWPLVNPTVVSLPLGFLGAVLGTLIAGRDEENEERFDAFLLQLHTGAALGIAASTKSIVPRAAKPIPPTS